MNMTGSLEKNLFVSHGFALDKYQLPTVSTGESSDVMKCFAVLMGQINSCKNQHHVCGLLLFISNILVY